MEHRRLAIIADDFTGALDTGIQFAKKGISIEVISINTERIKKVDNSVDVIVFDTESRHLDSAEAYTRVFDAVKACIDSGCNYIYKKTDSGLRGNIGSELKATMDASKSKALHFIPALPKIGRTTVDGIQLISGTPVSESFFGKDPINPVKHSKVKDIIAETADVCVVNGHSDIGISVYDAKDDEDLKRIGESLTQEELKLTAGNAGFAEYLSTLIGLEEREQTYTLEGKDLIIVSGSINKITLEQLDRASIDGYGRWILQGEEKVREDYFKSGSGDEIILSALDECHRNKIAIIDGGDPEKDTLSYKYANRMGMDIPTLWKPISKNFGRLIKRILELDSTVNILIIGGDTLTEALAELEIETISPVDEILQGVVLNRIYYNNKSISLMTKSGGFGPKDLVHQLENLIGKLSKGE
ncbi:MAG: four-carbon acid sugar kinase family protein [Sphaerochaetaceae bacterium]|nr:four-carbon acid sugar kinase family protein [Sphaerochaetaceae bacterium]